MLRCDVLSAADSCNLFESPQRLDVRIDACDAVHGVQHHHTGAEPTPAVRRRRPGLRIGAMHAQPGFDAEFDLIASKRLELLAQCCKLLLGLSIRRHDWHPAIAEPRRAPDYGIR